MSYVLSNESQETDVVVRDDFMRGLATHSTRAAGAWLSSSVIPFG
jgi:hypothetical protein